MKRVGLTLMALAMLLLAGCSSNGSSIRIRIPKHFFQQEKKDKDKKSEESEEKKDGDLVPSDVKIKVKIK